MLAEMSAGDVMVAAPRMDLIDIHDPLDDITHERESDADRRDDLGVAGNLVLQPRDLGHIGDERGRAATLADQRIPMFRRYQTNRDIVLIDQRGTGDSNPLDCAADDAEDEDGFGRSVWHAATE